MFNKNYIIVGVVILTLGVSIFYFSSGGVSLTGGDLTRAKAQQILWEAKKDSSRTVSVNYWAPGQFGASGTGFAYPYHEKVMAMEKAGLVKITGRALGGDLFEFTDKAQPYVSELKDKDSSLPSKDIKLGEPVSLEVTGLTSPSEDSSQKTMKFEYTITYRLTPFGEVLGTPTTEKSFDVFVLYDDGWRLR